MTRKSVIDTSETNEHAIAAAKALVPLVKEIGFVKAVEACRRALVDLALIEARGNMSEAARLFKTERNTLYLRKGKSYYCPKKDRPTS